MPDFTQLTDAKAAFLRDGFAVAREVLNPDEVRVMVGRIDGYIEELVPGMDPMHFFCEDKSDLSTLFRLEKMNLYDPYFVELSEQFEAPAAELLDDRADFRSVEMFGKPPKVGKPTPAHQDGNYFKITPNEALTFWIAVDPVTEVNGCVRYVAGSQVEGMRDHALSYAFGFSLGITDYGDADRAREVAAIVEPGDVVIHHSMVIHRADANPSDQQRRAIGLVYYAGKARKDEEATAAHQALVKTKWADDGNI